MGGSKARRSKKVGGKRIHKSTTKSGTTTNSVAKNLTAKGTATFDKKHADSLLEKVDFYINTFQYDIARKLCKEAVEVDPHNCKALEILAGLLLECGELEDATATLLRAVELCPSEGHSKYFSLGQLSEGLESLEFYRKGVDILLPCLQDLNSGDEEQASNVSTLKNELSSAYCAMAEIYMTDCCFEKNAEENCRLFAQKSIEADPSNPEAYQCFASFLMIKDDIEEAKSSMKKSLTLWLPHYQAVREERSDLESHNTSQFIIPSYDSRLNGSKLLIELEMFDDAVEVLESLTEEDDEVVTTWYLLGWLNYLRGEDYWGNARFYFKKVQKVAVKTQKGDEDQIVHANEMLLKLGPGSESDDDDEEEEEDDDENKENDGADDFPSESESESDKMEL